MMTDDKSRRYTDADVNRIIKRALKLETTESISHVELLETARELGIDSEKIEQAIEQETAAMEHEKKRQAYLKRAQSYFKAGLGGYLILNTFLFILDVMTPGGWWFQWPLLGTSLPLAFKFKNAYFPSEALVNMGIARWHRRKNKFHKARRRKNFPSSSRNNSDFGQHYRV